MMSLAKGDDLLLLLQKFPDVFSPTEKPWKSRHSSHANQIGN